MSDQSTQQSSSNLFARIFMDHPATVDETYFEHMRFALTFWFWLSIAAFCAFVHAFIPVLFETTASRILNRLHAKIHSRH